MSNNRRVRYSRLEDRCPKNTLVTYRNENLVYFGISRCHSKNDRFSKELGKDLAETRAQLALNEAGNIEESNMSIHRSGLRGVAKVDEVKQLLTYFQNIDNIMLSEEYKYIAIESVQEE